MIYFSLHANNWGVQRWPFCTFPIDTTAGGRSSVGCQKMNQHYLQYSVLALDGSESRRVAPLNACTLLPWVKADWFTLCVKCKHYIKNKIAGSPATKHTLGIRMSMFSKCFVFCFEKKRKEKALFKRIWQISSRAVRAAVKGSSPRKTAPWFWQF